jgi:hypothetical protein
MSQQVGDRNSKDCAMVLLVRSLQRCSSDCPGEKTKTPAEEDFEAL